MSLAEPLLALIYAGELHLRVKEYRHAHFGGQFLETICILDGVPQHLEWHQQRIHSTIEYFFLSHHEDWRLEKLIDVPYTFKKGKTRCRVIYNDREISLQYYTYVPRDIQSLKLVEIPGGYDYRYKYAGREVLDTLFERRKKADDVLLTRNGWITDTSVANIAFEKNSRWYTPSLPLLAGTTWKRLISESILIPTPIHRNQLINFNSFRLFNALNDWHEGEGILIEGIQE